MHLQMLLSLIVVQGSGALVACSSGGGLPSDAGRDAFDGEDGGDQANCAAGTEPTATINIGPGGGRLGLCGATLLVPPGSVQAETAFNVTRSAPQLAPPFEFLQVGEGFTMSSSTPPTGPIGVILPYQNQTDGVVYPAFAQTNSWSAIEPCLKDDPDHIHAHLFDLGTFAVIQDSEVFTKPGGSGTLAATLDGNPRAFSLIGGGNFAVFSPDASGERLITLSGWTASSDGRFKMDFYLNATGQADTSAVVEIVLKQPDGSFEIWNADPINQEVVKVTATLVDGNHLQGTFSGTARSPNSQLTITGGQFDATVEKYRWPLEAVCIFDENF